jgi:hypothetical protein
MCQRAEYHSEGAGVSSLLGDHFVEHIVIDQVAVSR